MKGENHRLLMVNSALREMLLRHKSAAEIDAELPRLIRHLEVMRAIGYAKPREFKMPPLRWRERVRVVWDYLRGGGQSVEAWAKE